MCSPLKVNFFFFLSPYIWPSLPLFSLDVPWIQASFHWELWMNFKMTSQFLRKSVYQICVNFKNILISLASFLVSLIFWKIVEARGKMNRILCMTKTVVIFFFFLVLKYWHKALYTFKVYNIMTWVKSMVKSLPR